MLKHFKGNFVPNQCFKDNFTIKQIKINRLEKMDEEGSQVVKCKGPTFGKARAAMEGNREERKGKG